MFRNRFYEQAMKCFNQAGEDILENRSKAYFLAETAAKDLAEVEADRVFLKELKKGD